MHPSLYVTFLPHQTWNKCEAIPRFLSMQKLWISFPIAKNEREWMLLALNFYLIANHAFSWERIEAILLDFPFAAMIELTPHSHTMLDSNCLWNGKWVTAVNAFLFPQSFKYLSYRLILRAPCHANMKSMESIAMWTVVNRRKKKGWFPRHLSAYEPPIAPNAKETVQYHNHAI